MYGKLRTGKWVHSVEHSPPSSPSSTLCNLFALGSDLQSRLIYYWSVKTCIYVGGESETGFVLQSHWSETGQSSFDAPYFISAWLCMSPLYDFVYPRILWFSLSRQCMLMSIQALSGFVYQRII